MTANKVFMAIIEPETSSSLVCFDVDTRRTTETSSHHRWSCVSGCCVACLEFSSNFGQGNPVTACVPPTIEDSTVCHLFSGRL